MSCEKSSSLGVMISPGQMPVLSPSSKSWPACSLLLPGLIRLSLWIFFLSYFHLPPTAQASPAKQRHCQTGGLHSCPALRAPLPLCHFLLSLRLKGNLFILPTTLRHFQFSKEVDLLYSLVGKETTFSSLLKHHFFFLQRENSTLYSPQMQLSIKWHFSSTF